MTKYTFDLDHFNIDKIADSGQVFRWKKIQDGVWKIPSMEKCVLVDQKGSHVTLDCLSEDVDFWVRYLAIEEDYNKVFNELGNRSPSLDKALEFSDGIRILRQPFFETAISFICSQNNNITNISKSLDLLCGNNDNFPAPEDIVSHLQMDSCKLGYRVPYLSLFARAYSNGIFDELNKRSCDFSYPLEFKEADFQLRQTKGIGPKVSACICLFSLGYNEAVPRDTWIKKLEDKYNVSWHSDLAGIQQQFMFHAIRHNVI